MKRLLLLVLCLILAAGCANVPLESQPVVVSGERPGQAAGADAPDPPQNTDPLSLVRAFVGAAVQPLQNYAAARAYLDDDGRANWKPSPGLTIIQNTFGTVYDPSPSPDPNILTVNVRGIMVGQLGPDSAFVPRYESFMQAVKVRKQADGQWRIENAPPDLRVTEDNFAANFTKVEVNFLAATGAFVPDPRYVVAKPQAGLPSRVMNLLLDGPSAALRGAVQNVLRDAGQAVAVDTNIKSLDDGTLVVPLTGLTGVADQVRSMIAAQIVLSLQYVASTRIRILADGAPLLQGQQDFRASELPSYGASLSPNPLLLGLMTVDGRVKSLGDGLPVAGPAGNGSIKVLSAAQSVDGKRLAVVEQAGAGVRLRIGDLGHDLTPSITGSTMSRPTWRPGSGGSELWTVLDHSSIARLVIGGDGKWTPLQVNSADLTALGAVTELRFSRDGSRVAAVVDGSLVVASVVTSGDSVALREPRRLQEHDLKEVVDVDWLSPDRLVVSTLSTSQPVVRVEVDGQRMDPYNSSNLTPTIHGVTAAPSRPIVVADDFGLWTASELGEVWRPQLHSAPKADPFYPG